MKKSLFVLILGLMTIPALAEEAVTNVVCTAGAGQYGNEIVIELSKTLKYGKLTIKRAPAGSDYVKDLSSFVGGKYRLDLAAKGGITGYSLEYAAKDAATWQTAEGALSCSASAEPSAVAPTPPPAT